MKDWLAVKGGLQATLPALCFEARLGLEPCVWVWWGCDWRGGCIQCSLSTDTPAASLAATDKCAYSPPPLTLLHRRCLTTSCSRWPTTAPCTCACSSWRQRAHSTAGTQTRCSGTERLQVRQSGGTACLNASMAA